MAELKPCGLSWWSLDWCLASLSAGVCPLARVEKAIEYMMSTGDVWFATMEEIAAHVTSVTDQGSYNPRVDKLPYHSEPQVPQDLIGKSEA